MVFFRNSFTFLVLLSFDSLIRSRVSGGVEGSGEVLSDDEDDDHFSGDRSSDDEILSTVITKTSTKFETTYTTIKPEFTTQSIIIPELASPDITSAQILTDDEDDAPVEMGSGLDDSTVKIKTIGMVTTTESVIEITEKITTKPTMMTTLPETTQKPFLTTSPNPIFKKQFYIIYTNSKNTSYKITSKYNTESCIVSNNGQLKYETCSNQKSQESQTLQKSRRAQKQQSMDQGR